MSFPYAFSPRIDGASTIEIPCFAGCVQVVDPFCDYVFYRHCDGTKRQSYSRCWYAVTYQGSNTQCFSTSTISGASNIGTIARTFSSYSSGTNDLYGYMYNLQSKYKLTVSPYTVDWEPFTEAGTNPGIYKCWSTKSATGSGYVIDYLTNWNTIGTGPRTYTTDNCSDVSQVGDPYGERSTAGGN